MQKSHHPLWSTGSTIIEVLIATTLVAFALTGLAMLMTNNVKNSAEADYREAAAGIAQDTMERIRQSKTTKSWSLFKSDTFTGICSIPTTKYNTKFFTSCPPPNPVDTDGNLRTITVVVCWPATDAACMAGAKTTKIVQRFYNN